MKSECGDNRDKFLYQYHQPPLLLPFLSHDHHQPVLAQQWAHSLSFFLLMMMLVGWLLV